jgi:hypothetical protein
LPGSVPVICEFNRVAEFFITLLVGKNEAGKTAILQALHALRPQNEAKTTFDVTQEYPRRFVTRFDERHPDGRAIVVQTWWQLNNEARRLLTDEFGESALIGDEFQICKYYDDNGSTHWTMPISEENAVRNLIDQAQFNAVEKKAVGDAKTVKALIEAINGLSEKTAKHTALLTRASQYRDHSVTKKAIDLINDLVPRFFYTSHYDRMNGQISVDALLSQRARQTAQIGDRIFLDFLELAGTSLDELRTATRYEALVAKCEAASNDITEQIFAYWTQNDALEVKLDFSEGRTEDPAPFDSGTVVRARVWNGLHRASVPFSERSAGFVWFFSFLVQFAAMRAEAGNVIILLDEPGLTLHGKAQADLLRYIQEELLSYHQVIFSTHSPFMVPADRLLTVRIVEDVVDRSKPRPEVKGTKVREDVLVTDRDTLFPLQGALGYDLTQSLFVGKHTLLVEGPSDILYLQALSSALKLRGRTGLDARWTLCPSGGIGNIRPFVSLFGSNHLDIAVLADHVKSDIKKIEELRRSQILEAGRVLTVAQFAGKDEADIEDLFSPVLFTTIVNSAYGLPESLRLTAQALVDAAPNTNRQVKQAEAAFNVMPQSIPTYDHFTPSAWLIRNGSLLDTISDDISETLDRAEALFNAVNSLLE